MSFSIKHRELDANNRRMDGSLPLVAANQKYANRKFASIALVCVNESWVRTGRHG